MSQDIDPLAGSAVATPLRMWQLLNGSLSQSRGAPLNSEQRDVIDAMGNAPSAAELAKDHAEKLRVFLSDNPAAVSDQSSPIASSEFH